MIDNRLSVKAGDKPAYDIIIKDSYYGLLEELPRLNSPDRKICIVTDKKVASLYLQEVYELTQYVCDTVKVFAFEEGEASKNLSTVSSLYEFLIRNGYDRKDMLIALGGGVTGDLTGFAAATYLRGIDYVQMPTSLLSQVDSSIGGKTGVDFLQYKNMVGAFYMPKLVYINVNTLSTLSDRQYVSGLGEVIKHGLIRDRDYFEWICAHREEIRDRDPEAMAYMVEGSIRIKRAVVEEDPMEKGIRAILNYGHTLGHSIEKLTGYRLTHGECVGLGSLLSASVSLKRGLLTPEDYGRIVDLYTYFGFPSLPEDLDPDRVVEETRHDKKMEHGRIRFILLSGIGNAGICKDVSEEEMKMSFRGNSDEA